MIMMNLSQLTKEQLRVLKILATNYQQAKL